ncbi:hypothetical protein [Prevotella pallens]|uniref:hypothetical protein n=1 Tax=Prevotella pallens TaxID=60133 RepID=UPI0023EFFB00|nr:hypothetical protein [Prevotella pallens]
MISTLYEKAWESVPITRPTSESLRIARCRLNEQRRSPRRYVSLLHITEKVMCQQGITHIWISTIAFLSTPS